MQLRHRLTVGRPQYCVTRAVLHCLVDDAETFSWMTRREKQWLIAYVQVAGPEPLEVAYDEAVELYEQAMICRFACEVSGAAFASKEKMSRNPQ